MFRSLSLYKQNRSLLFNGGSTFTSCFLKTPFRSISDNLAPTPTHHNSFTVSYLINSCGLSQDKAISASKKIQLKSSTQPDSVLTLLRNHEFPDTHISKIIQKFPLLLLVNADKTLKPKLEYFNSLGFSGSDLSSLLATDPHLLRHSLEKRIMPSIAFLKSILHTQSNIFAAIKRSTWLLHQDLQKRLAPNIALLQTVGVSHCNIFKLLVTNARPLLRAKRFNQIVEETKKMQFDPSQDVFVRAILALSSLSKSSWEAKFDIFKRWGWSNDDILMAFRKKPQFIMLSEKNIMGTMEFLVNKMSYDPLLIAKNPTLLTFSLEKRIIPRLSVIQVLITNGFLEKDCNIYTVLQHNDEEFVKKFVTEFEEKVPQLLNTYKRKMEYSVSTH